MDPLNSIEFDTNHTNKIHFKKPNKQKMWYDITTTTIFCVLSKILIKNN